MVQDAPSSARFNRRNCASIDDIAARAVRPIGECVPCDEANPVIVTSGALAAVASIHEVRVSRRSSINSPARGCRSPIVPRCSCNGYGTIAAGVRAQLIYGSQVRRCTLFASRTSIPSGRNTGTDHVGLVARVS